MIRAICRWLRGPGAYADGGTVPTNDAHVWAYHNQHRFRAQYYEFKVPSFGVKFWQLVIMN